MEGRKSNVADIDQLSIEMVPRIANLETVNRF
jgi:hypothetical protein